MYYVYMRFPQMIHCNIAPLHQLLTGICHNNVTVDNTFPTCFGEVQVVYMHTYILYIRTCMHLHPFHASTLNTHETLYAV